MLRFLTLLSATLCFAALSSSPVQAEDQVYELRTYTAAPGKMDALLKRFREHTNSLFEKHGIKVIGYWIPTEEPKKSNTLIYVCVYPSREAAKKSWAAFINDPDWKKAKEASEVDGKLAEKVESVYMSPADFSKMK